MQICTAGTSAGVRETLWSPLGKHPRVFGKLLSLAHLVRSTGLISGTHAVDTAAVYPLALCVKAADRNELHEMQVILQRSIYQGIFFGFVRAR
jgi:hypothetical protein